MARLAKRARVSERRSGKRSRHTARFEQALQLSIQLDGPGHGGRNAGFLLLIRSAAAQPKRYTDGAKNEPESYQTPTLRVQACGGATILRRGIFEQVAHTTKNAHLLVNIESFYVLPPALGRRLENFTQSAHETSRKRARLGAGRRRRIKSDPATFWQIGFHPRMGIALAHRVKATKSIVSPAHETGHVPRRNTNHSQHHSHGGRIKLAMSAFGLEQEVVQGVGMPKVALC